MIPFSNHCLLQKVVFFNEGRMEEQIPSVKDKTLDFKDK